MAQILKFYDKDHIYELDGEQVPSVSELSRFASREIYGDITQYILDNAAERGKKVHQATENLDRYGDVEISEDIAPYVQAYLQFRRDHNLEYKYIEKALASSSLKFAGTLDRVAIMDGRIVIIDIKTSAKIQDVLAQIQLVGYKKLYEENFGDNISALYILHLNGNGKYKLIEYPADETLFVACYNLHNALKKERKKKKR